jgi:ankyrin repeat protein
MEKQFYINAADHNGDNALHIAAKKDYQVLVDVLVR